MFLAAQGPAQALPIDALAGLSLAAAALPPWGPRTSALTLSTYLHLWLGHKGATQSPISCQGNLAHELHHPAGRGWGLGGPGGMEAGKRRPG